MMPACSASQDFEPARVTKRRGGAGVRPPAGPPLDRRRGGGADMQARRETFDPRFDRPRCIHSEPKAFLAVARPQPPLQPPRRATWRRRRLPRPDSSHLARRNRRSTRCCACTGPGRLRSAIAVVSHLDGRTDHPDQRAGGLQLSVMRAWAASQTAAYPLAAPWPMVMNRATRNLHITSKTEAPASPAPRRPPRRAWPATYHESLCHRPGPKTAHQACRTRRTLGAAPCGSNVKQVGARRRETRTWRSRTSERDAA
jgi:hypothetical protein